jgi:hypothetical protein
MSQPLIPTGERSGLWTRTDGTRFIVYAEEKLAFWNWKRLFLSTYCANSGDYNPVANDWKSLSGGPDVPLKSTARRGKQVSAPRLLF